MTEIPVGIYLQEASVFPNVKKTCIEAYNNASFYYAGIRALKELISVKTAPEVKA
jgi:hypothetical protein